jgi:hypothetical protein
MLVATGDGFVRVRKRKPQVGEERSTRAFLSSKQKSDELRQSHLRDLDAVGIRLSREIGERRTNYVVQLESDERTEIDNQWAQLNAKPQFTQVNKERQTGQQIFESLRQINGGAYPRNLSPVLYVIPLVLVGLAEWYVNFATFAAIFIPVFAIAGTLLVAAVFAWASHMHGAYLKQLAEIIHPSMEYRNVLGRKIALVISTILLIAALFTVVWLRYVVIADQLGISPNATPGTFGEPSSTMIWSRLGPTIVLNILIWGLGTLYSWAMNEKVPGLRESYRDLQRAEGKLRRLRKPSEKEEQRIRAAFKRKREQNQVAINEYNHSLSEIGTLFERLKQQQ